MIKSDNDVIIKSAASNISSTKDDTYLNSTSYRNSDRYSVSSSRGHSREHSLKSNILDLNSSKKGHSREHSLKSNSSDFNKDVYGDKISLLQARS